MDTAFAGKLHDVWFRGGFPYQSSLQNFGTPRKNTMLRVSFEDAVLSWVTFSDDCDLSTVTLPSTGCYRLYDRWNERLEYATSALAGWPQDDRMFAFNYLRTLKAHAETQHWYILNVQEVVDELGSGVGGSVLEVLGRPLVLGSG